jgi:hypothetical protein
MQLPMYQSPRYGARTRSGTPPANQPGCQTVGVGCTVESHQAPLREIAMLGSMVAIPQSRLYCENSCGDCFRMRETAELC